MRTNWLLPLVLPALAIAGTEDPWGQANAERGKPLHDQSCIACHARMYGGDGSKMYTREGRMTTNRKELLQRVATCNAMTRTGWGATEESAVAAWLNHQYYHFDQ